MQRRAEFFLDLFIRLDELKDICGVIDVLGGLKDFHITRLKKRIWVGLALTAHRKHFRKRR